MAFIQIETYKHKFYTQNWCDPSSSIHMVFKKAFH